MARVALICAFAALAAGNATTKEEKEDDHKDISALDDQLKNLEEKVDALLTANKPAKTTLVGAPTDNLQLPGKATHKTRVLRITNETDPEFMRRLLGNYTGDPKLLTDPEFHGDGAVSSTSTGCSAWFQYWSLYFEGGCAEWYARPVPPVLPRFEA